MGVVGAVVIGVGVAAANPGSGGTITACYTRSTGLLRVIENSGHCRWYESKLVWSTGSASTSLGPGSVVGGPGGVVADNTLTKDDLAPNSVESSELADGSVDTAALGDDAVTSGRILNGEVGTDDLAGDAVTSGKILNGEVGTDDLAGDAVTSAKIDDGTIASGDLAGGAVTMDKVTANLVASFSVIAPPSGGTALPATSASLDLGNHHKLLVMGQTQLTCSTCTTPADMAAVRWQVFEDTGAGGDVAVSQEFRSNLAFTSPSTPAAVSVLVPDSGASGAHTYKLKVSYTASGAATVTSSGDSLSVVDLGR